MCGIDHEDHAAPAAKLAYLAQRHRSRADVTRARADQHSGVFAHQARNFCAYFAWRALRIVDHRVKNAVIYHSLAPKPMDRAQNGVMLEIRDQHVIPSPYQALDGDIERLGRARAEANSLRSIAIKEAAEPFSAPVDRLRRIERELMRASARVTAVIPHKIAHFVYHTAGFGEARSRVIEVDQLSCIHFFTLIPSLASTLSTFWRCAQEKCRP